MDTSQYSGGKTYRRHHHTHYRNKEVEYRLGLGGGQVRYFIKLIKYRKLVYQTTYSDQDSFDFNVVTMFCTLLLIMKPYCNKWLNIGIGAIHLYTGGTAVG